jgi:geranylgeranyl diphosphate synthase type II
MIHTFEQLEAEVGKALEAVRLGKDPPELYDPIAYALSVGGKRIRPVLLLMGCEAFGGNIAGALPAAVSVELFHNFTLLHDDIMDKAYLRRGWPTVYRKWNADIALLAGDTLMALAYDHLLKTEGRVLKEVLSVFNQAAIEVCEGQQLDMNYEAIQEVNLAEYMKMIRLKTSVLLGASLSMGAIIAGAPREEAAKLYASGISLGIAFQLMDDVLDTYGEQEKFGKKTGSDIINNKKTCLYVKALELADKGTARRLKELYGTVAMDDRGKIAAVMEIFGRFDVRLHAEELMNFHYSQAVATLDGVKIEEKNKSEIYKTFRRILRRQS